MLCRVDATRAAFVGESFVYLFVNKKPDLLLIYSIHFGYVVVLRLWWKGCEFKMYLAFVRTHIYIQKYCPHRHECVLYHYDGRPCWGAHIGRHGDVCASYLNLYQTHDPTQYYCNSAQYLRSTMVMMILLCHSNTWSRIAELISQSAKHAPNRVLLHFCLDSHTYQAPRTLSLLYRNCYYPWHIKFVHLNYSQWTYSRCPGYLYHLFYWRVVT